MLILALGVTACVPGAGVQQAELQTEVAAFSFAPVDGAPTLPAFLANYSDVNWPRSYTSTFRRDGSVLSHDNTPRTNPVTDAGATLGRVLFYDTDLSSDGTVSCGTCHQQSRAFTDGLQTSEGVNGHTRRNTSSLVNARFYDNGRFFWDERAATLEEQVIMPILDPIEMGLTEPQMIAAIEARDWYGPLFAQAFGDQNVTTERVADALAQFIRSIVSTQSRYDFARQTSGSARDRFASFSRAENQGKRLFFNGGRGRTACVECHATEAFITDSSRGGEGPSNNGLDRAPTDGGVFETTGDRRDFATFKPPSLRNIALTAPYMHDGRFETLGEVIDHYSDGVEQSATLSDEFRGNGNANFTPQERAALIAFLNTLTDRSLLSDERFSDPFQ